MTADVLGNKSFRLFLTAMRSEAMPIARYYNLLEVTDDALRNDQFTHMTRRHLRPAEYKSFPVFCNPIGLETVLIVTGVGKVNAAAATALGIQMFDPSHVVNVGLCGALTSHNRVGDMVRVAQAIQYDCYCPMKSDEFEDLYRIMDLDLSRLDAEAAARHAFVKLATGDRFIDDEEARDELAKVADVADMEGYAVARTCARMGKRLSMYKLVSDAADSDAAEDMPHVYQTYAERVTKLLEML